MKQGMPLSFIYPASSIQYRGASSARPARPGATQVGQCPGEQNPVWARGAIRSREAITPPTRSVFDPAFDMSSLRSELRVEDRPNVAQTEGGQGLRRSFDS